MDLTIINSINNNTYANNLHIQNTHPKRILHLYIYNDIVRSSYVTVLYDKINSIIYFDKKPN